MINGSDTVLIPFSSSSKGPVGEMTVHDVRCQQREYWIDLTVLTGAAKAFVYKCRR